MKMLQCWWRAAVQVDAVPIASRSFSAKTVPPNATLKDGRTPSTRTNASLAVRSAHYCNCSILYAHHFPVLQDSKLKSNKAHSWEVKIYMLLRRKFVDHLHQQIAGKFCNWAAATAVKKHSIEVKLWSATTPISYCSALKEHVNNRLNQHQIVATSLQHN